MAEGWVAAADCAVGGGVASAARLADVSVSEVMAGAGLTVGGFHAHFRSKGELADEAVRQAMSERRRSFLSWPVDRMVCRARELAGGRLELALRGYSTARHRDDVQDRCSMPMTVVDAARNGGGATVFAEEVARMRLSKLGESTAARAPGDAEFSTAGRAPRDTEPSTTTQAPRDAALSTAARTSRDGALGSLALMVGGMILADATRGTALSAEVLGSAGRCGAAALRDLEGVG